jgi:hypothetical protein
MSELQEKLEEEQVQRLEQTRKFARLQLMEQDLNYSKNQLTAFEQEVSLYRSKQALQRIDATQNVDERELEPLFDRVVLSKKDFDCHLEELQKQRMSGEALEIERYGINIYIFCGKLIYAYHNRRYALDTIDSLSQQILDQDCRCLALEVSEAGLEDKIITYVA